MSRRDQPTVSRRTALATWGVAGLGLGAVSSACTSSAGDPRGSGTGDRAVLPTHREPEGVPAPDFPGIPGRLSAGYLTYPQDPPSLADAHPGSGGSMSAAYPIYGATPPPVEQNAYWQAINAELNIDFRPTLVMHTEWSAKFATMVAGDDIPDLVSATEDSPRLASLLEAKFTDLTEFLSGDAILDYPNLAHMPEESWKGAVHNGKIFAVPQAKEPMPAVMFARKDLIDGLGLDADWQSFAEFRALCGEMSWPKENRWAIASDEGALEHVLSMLGLPNAWIEDGGAFTSRIETEEYRQALSSVAQLWADGVLHPDALGSTTTDGKQWMAAGTCLLHWDGFLAWNGDVFKAAGLGSKLTCVVPPGYDGGPGRSAVSKPWARLTLMRKAPPERIRELLEVLNHLYAPFGSKEYLLKTFGVEGTHFTYDGTEPIPTQQGIAETALMMSYVVTPPTVTYVPGDPETTRAMSTYGQSVQEIIVPDPTVGLVSETMQSSSSELDTLIKDVVHRVVSGRADLDDFDGVVDTWRDRGGNAIKNELQEARERSA